MHNGLTLIVAYPLNKAIMVESKEIFVS